MSQPIPSTAPSATPTLKRRRANSVGEPSKRKCKQQKQQQPGDKSADSNYVIIAILQQEVASLKSVVTNQQQTITNLASRLNDVLAAFGFQPVKFDQSPFGPSSISLSSSGGVTATNTQSVATSSGVQQSSSSTSSGQSSSYVQAVSRPPTTRAIRENVIAAVYVDQAAHGRRATSFIVSGLPTSTDLSDSAIVAQSCSAELGLQPNITATKRLGKPTSGKIQPILVQTKDVQGAQSVINNAKRLRQSNFPFIKSAVFINANLTKAEAMASYEMRSRRRHAVQVWATHTSTNNIATAPNPIIHSNPTVMDLNPTASIFHPPATITTSN